MQKRFEAYLVKNGFRIAIVILSLVLFTKLHPVVQALITAAIPSGTVWSIWRIRRARQEKLPDVVGESGTACSEYVAMPWSLRLLVVGLNLASVRAIYLGYRMELADHPVRTSTVTVALGIAAVWVVAWHLYDEVSWFRRRCKQCVAIWVRVVRTLKGAHRQRTPRSFNKELTDQLLARRAKELAERQEAEAAEAADAERRRLAAGEEQKE